MTLRRKALLISAVIFVMAIALFFAVSQMIIMRSFSRLERREMHQHMDRIVRALQEEIAALDTLLYDWSGWDDTYEYVVDHNQGYADANLADETWFVLETNIVMFVDNDGKVVFGRELDLVNREGMPLPDSLLEHLQQGQLLAHNDLESVVTGWLYLPEGLLMIVSRPIITTDHQGPIHGTMILGRFVTTERIAALSELVHVDVSFWDIDDTRLPAGLHIAPTAPSDESLIFAQPNGNNRFSGYSVLYDIYGQPVQVVQADIPRSIYQQGLSSLYYLFAAIGAVTLAFTAVMWLMLDRTILARLTLMGDAFRQIRTTHDISLRVPVRGRDEIMQLGCGFNELLDTLAQTQHALEQARDQLEVRVRERTAQLVASNQQLREEIVERKRAQHEVAAARDQALDALRVKSQILANVSHDARTPLGVIVLRTQMLQKRLDGTLGDKERQMFDTVLSSAYQLTRFVENLLSEARASAHKVELHCAEFKPAVLVGEVKAMMGAMAERKGLILTTEIGEQVPPVLIGDVEHLKQILLNLTDNAIKFTDRGSVTVRIDYPDETHWSLQVKDTGTGISTEAQEHIFEAFYQGDGSLTRDVNRGVGLGLSIVKGLATLMNGDITVQSEPGQGTAFTITFLLQPNSEKDNHD
jgi:signal transduction histidine kinase